MKMDFFVSVAIQKWFKISDPLFWFHFSRQKIIDIVEMIQFQRLIVDAVLIDVLLSWLKSSLVNFLLLLTKDSLFQDMQIHFILLKLSSCWNMKQSRSKKQ